MTFSIVYRAYSGETEENFSLFRPRWFSKFKCWKTFWNEFGSKTDVTVLWDGDLVGKYYEYIKSFNPRILNFGKVGNKGSLLKTYEILMASDNNIVGAVEDDYYFLPGSLGVIKDGFNYGFPMICTYDHIDRYSCPSTDVTFGKEEIYLGKNNYWRSAESTTGTCFFKKSTFNNVYDKLIEYNVNDRPFFRDCLQNGLRLYSPMPGTSTHCVKYPEDLMSPFVDWEAFSNSIVL